MEEKEISEAKGKKECFYIYDERMLKHQERVGDRELDSVT
jgi:hypothetical protein